MDYCEVSQGRNHAVNQGMLILAFHQSHSSHWIQVTQCHTWEFRYRLEFHIYSHFYCITEVFLKNACKETGTVTDRVQAPNRLY